MHALFVHCSRWVSIASLLLLMVCTARGATVTRLSVDSKPSYSRMVIEFDKPVRHNPTDQIRSRGFFYLDIYGLDMAYNEKLLTVNDSALRYVQAVCYPAQGVLRLVFYVKSTNSTFQINMIENPARLVIDTVASDSGKLTDIRITEDDLRNGRTNKSSGDVTLSMSGPMRQTSGTAQVPEPNYKRNGGDPGKWKYVIIDPGHGGENGGATSGGTINGKQVREKDLTMQFAYHLKKIIDASPNMVALLTRTNDCNMSLPDRIAFAKENQGDFFLSIHMNYSNENSSARGMEIFYLDDKGVVGATDKLVEERENREIGQTVKRSGMNPIVLNMLSDLDKYTVEKLQRESLDACNRLHTTMCSYAGFRTHTRGIKCANFVVLRNAAVRPDLQPMPAALLEVGFLSNSEDLKYLVNPKFQQVTAMLIFNGLCDYFTEVDPEFKARKMNVASFIAGQ